MASDLEFAEFVCEQMNGVYGISHRKMFGEYAIYVNDKVVALVCDNQLFVKPTGAGRVLLGKPREAPPYPGAKLHFLIEGQLDDREFMAALIAVTDRELPAPKPKGASKKKVAKKGLKKQKNVAAKAKASTARGKAKTAGKRRG